MLPNYSNNKNNANYGSVENRNAVALAMHHAGVATDMIYSTNGSGTGSLPVARALASYFKYNKGMEIARKLIYTEAEWFALIKNELDDKPSHLENALSGNSFNAYGYQGKLFIIADKEADAKIFSVDGRRVKTVNLHEGENIIEDLNNGLYIINNQKVSIQ